MKQLITPADVTARTVISLSAEPHKIHIAVPLAQGKHLRPLLGLQLFDELLDFAESLPPSPVNSPAGLAAYELAVAEWRLGVADEPLLKLFDEMKEMLCAWTVIEMWPSLLGHITPAGIVLKTGKSEGTTIADEKVMNAMFAGLESTAVFHTEELNLWLAKRRPIYAQYFPLPTPAATGRLPIGGICFG